MIVMEKEFRKYLYLDIDEKVATEILGAEKEAELFGVLEKFMEQEGFCLTKGSLSIYHSTRPMSIAEVEAVVDRMVEAYPFMTKCVRDSETGDILNETHIIFHED